MKPTYALASPSFAIFGKYGAVISLLSNFFQSTSANHGCANTSPAPCARFPKRLLGSRSMNFNMRSVACALNAGHLMHAGPCAIFS